MYLWYPLVAGGACFGLALFAFVWIPLDMRRRYSLTRRPWPRAGRIWLTGLAALETFNLGMGGVGACIILGSVGQPPWSVLRPEAYSAIVWVSGALFVAGAVAFLWWDIRVYRVARRAYGPERNRLRGSAAGTENRGG